jgi:IclR family pca regulon transcriptional regulator
MSRADFEDSADYVQSLARGLSVLRAFNHGLPSATLSEVAQRRVCRVRLRGGHC